MNPSRTIVVDIGASRSIFVRINGDIYVDSGDNNKTVLMWTQNITTAVVAMHVTRGCMGLFIDINDNIYCSYDVLYLVIKQPIDRDNSSRMTVAGNGSAGSTPNTLCEPRGLFVDIDMTLYVADCLNDRVQRFQNGQLNGATVAGAGAPGTITLMRPVALLHDAEGYLFIADRDQSRIVGSSASGFRCIVGCTEVPGSESNRLHQPYTFNFDSYGNLFVVDRNNDRIQKFLLSTNTCSKCCPLFHMLVVFRSTVEKYHRFVTIMHLTLSADIEESALELDPSYLHAHFCVSASDRHLGSVLWHPKNHISRSEKSELFLGCLAFLLRRMPCTFIQIHLMKEKVCITVKDISKSRSEEN